MTAVGEFLAMGGYAFYVWSSFGVAALLLGGVALWSALEARRAERTTFARALRPRRETGRAGTPSGPPIDPSTAPAAAPSADASGEAPR